MASIHRPPSAACFPPTLHGLTPDDLAAYFTAAWDSYEWLYSGVEQSSYLEHTRTHPFRNTLSFYYGHTAAFYAAKLRAAGLMSEPVAAWDQAMATGVWPRAAADIADSQDWPSFHALQGYRREVRGRIDNLIAGLTIAETVTEQDPVWAVLMGIEHELIHFHLSLPLIRRVPLSRVAPPSDWIGCNLSAKVIDADDWHACDGGTVSFGRVRGEHDFYGWDNEYGQKTMEVKPFAMRRYPVTNRELLEFVEAGGYGDPRWWVTPEVETWFRTMEPKHPASWVYRDGTYLYRAPFEERPMPWSWPVEVCKHEAAAYAAWAGARLPSEAQFHAILRQECPDRDACRSRMQSANVALRYCSPAPVGALVPNDSRTGVDLLGNLAYWADGPFQALDREQFAPNRLYPDFSRPWFRGDHSVLLGASYAALGHMTRVGLMRDFVQNHMDQLAGILLVRPR